MTASSTLASAGGTAHPDWLGARCAGIRSAGRSPTIWVLLAAALAASVPAGCSGTCSEVSSVLQTELRRELAVTGTGVGTPGGEVHLGLTFSPELLERILQESGSDLPAIQRPLSVTREGARGLASVRLDIAPRLRGITFEAGSADAVQLTFAIEGQVLVNAPGVNFRHIPGDTFGVSGSLRLEPDASGVTALRLHFVDAIEGGIQLDLPGLNEDVRQPIVEFVAPELSRLLFDQVESITLVRFPPLLAGGLEVALAPADLAVYPEQGSLFAGFATPLRPGGGGGIAPSPEAEPGGLRVWLHPGLQEAAVRLAIANDEIERAFDADAEAAADGPVRLTLDRFAVDGERFSLDFTMWDLRPGFCGSVPLLARGQVRRREDSMALVLTEIAAEWQTAEVDPSFDSGRWLNSSFAVGAVEVAERLLDRRRLEIGESGHLALVPSAYRADAGHIIVDLRPGPRYGRRGTTYRLTRSTNSPERVSTFTSSPSSR